MTKEEMKDFFEKSGLATAEIDKLSKNFDIEKITEIVEGTSSPKEAFEAIHAFYPEFEVENLQRQCDFIMAQFEAATKAQKEKSPVELTEEELENVSGGGLFDWMDGLSSGWKALAIAATAVVAATIFCTGVGAIGGGISAVVAGVSSFSAGAATGAGAGAIAGSIGGLVASSPAVIGLLCYN